MKTSSFFSFTGSGRISIARSAPRSAPAGYRTFKQLAPGPWFSDVPLERYRALYFDQLAQLDAGRVFEDLHALTGGAEPVLLCWERGPWSEKNFCHRRMAAEWFLAELGVVVDEI